MPRWQGVGGVRHSCGSALAHQMAARRRSFGLALHPRDGAIGEGLHPPPARPPTPRHPCPCRPPRRSPTWLRPSRRAHAPRPSVLSGRDRHATTRRSRSRVERSWCGACSRCAPRQAALPPRPSRPCARGRRGRPANACTTRRVSARPPAAGSWAARPHMLTRPPAQDSFCEQPGSCVCMIG